MEITQSNPVDKRRLICLVALIIFGFFIDTIRVIGISISTHEIISYQEQKKIYRERPRILDRNGTLLSSSIPTASVYAAPNKINNPKFIAEQVAKVLPKADYNEILLKLSSNKQFTWIARHISPKQQLALNSLEAPGLYLMKDWHRVYPQSNLFSHIIGQVDTDSNGISGIEMYIDSRAEQKEDLVLSLDIRVQNVLRQEMLHKMTEVGAIGAAGIVMDATNGEILASVSLPDFDPNLKSAAPKTDALFNRATLGLYEMGSTFKTFTMAASLEKKVAHMDEVFDVASPIKVANFVIKDFAQYKTLSFREIFSRSSNIGVAKIAGRIGAEGLKKFLDDLELTTTLHLEIPEKGAPIIPKNWTETTLLTVSYGYGLATSLMHMTQAIAAVTNGGTLCQATFIPGKKCPNGKKVVSKETSEKTREMMALAVELGTGKGAKVEGYEVGGKTGSAEKIINGAYDKTRNISSFIAIFPSNAPRYVVSIMIDEPDPKLKVKTGGAIAAPAVAEVIKKIGPILNLPPNN